MIRLLSVPHFISLSFCFIKFLGRENTFVSEASCLVCLFVLQTVSHNAYHQDPYAQEFGIRISNQLAQVEARILPAPRVCFHTLKISCTSNLCNPDVLCI